jgi:hypothetical protein
MNHDPLLSQLSFYVPSQGAGSRYNLKFPPELVKIFYIARVIFSDHSKLKIKNQLSPLFSRSQIFSSSTRESARQQVRQQITPMDNSLQIGKMSLMSDISRLIPREHTIYTENIFFKKLLNRELIKIIYQGAREEALSVDKFVGREEAELNRSQKVYLLFDNSTSMNGEGFNKIFAAKAITIEYLRKVSLESPQIFFRSFHSDVGEVVTARTSSEIYRLIDHITHLQTGGGHITNIGAAVEQALEDIKKDPELKEAEILVLTDGFGPVAQDLKAKLGSIKLHVILIPDLDIAKILELYPDRTSWENGGPLGSRPMPEFWQYYSKEPPPLRLEGDLYENSTRSYETAGKSVKELKKQEILQGLNQIYTIREHCENFIFVIITALFGETFKCYEEDIDSMAAAIEELKQRSIEQLTHSEKLSLLQTLNFMSELLQLALERAAKKNMKARIRELLKMVGILKARLLADPWLLSTINVVDDQLSIQFAATISSFFKDLPLAKALAMLVKFLWQTCRESLQNIFPRLLKFSVRQGKV